MRKKFSLVLTALAPLLCLAAAAALIAVLTTNGVYPSGADTLFHLYRGNAVLRSLREGMLFPFYDPMWFNGAELLRFSSPLCAYFLALCQALAGGSLFNGYLLFVGVLFYLEVLAFLPAGFRAGRPGLGLLLGFLWFFWPYHLQVLFLWGDLPRALACLFLPHLLCAVISWLGSGRRRNLVFAALSLCLMVLSHVGTAAMSTLCVIVLLVFCRAARVGRRFVPLLLSLLSGLLLSGIWLVPCLTGGILAQDQTDAMASSFQPVLVSLDPTLHLSDYSAAVPYFGLALFAVLLLCALFSPRRVCIQAWAALFMLLLTSANTYVLLRVIPGSQYLRLLWIFPALCVLGFLAVLGWTAPRRPVLILLCLLLCLDSIPFLPLVTGEGGKPITAEDRMSDSMRKTLLPQAQSLTDHRLAILDEGNTGSIGVGLATVYGESVPVIGGDSLTHAANPSRLQRISRALTSGQYAYVFDRCLELGCDTVLLQSRVVSPTDLINGVLDKDAQRLGYTLSADQGTYRIYHADLGSGWGLTTRYSAIGIGDGAYYASLAFPCMEETADPNLNHYTLEQLSQYELVYLSGFTYTDRASAEALVLALSDAGVRVVIDADGIPESQETRNRSFLSILCNTVELSIGYPELETVYGRFTPDLFLPGHSNWNTFFLEGLDQVLGTLVDNNITLPFYGTVHNDNISVIGLGLFYHYALTRDAAAGELISTVFGLSPQRLPYRRLVPLGVSYGPESITLTTPADRVNTTLAYHDFFSSDGELFTENGLLQVNAGETVVHIRYPGLLSGSLTSLLGLALLLILPLTVRVPVPPEAPAAEGGAEGPPAESGAPAAEGKQSSSPADAPPPPGAEAREEGTV